LAAWACRGRGAWCGVSSPEYTRIKKSPVTTGLQGYLSSPRLTMSVYAVFRWLIAPAEAPGRVVARVRVRSNKKAQNLKEGGSQTPQLVARIVLCRPEQSLATSAAGSRVVATIARGKGHEPNMSTHVRAHYRR
jgi:hypothetical protein